MNVTDQQQLTDLWHKNTCHLNEQIDDAFKLAQDQAYEIGLKRGRDASEKKCLECKQLAALDSGREAYLQGMERAAVIAETDGYDGFGKDLASTRAICFAVAGAIRADNGGDASTLAESHRWAVCRLYDTELITASRACELLGGIKAQDFRTLYAEFMDGKGGIDDTVAETR